MIAAFDVHYGAAHAQVGCVIFENWQAETAIRSHVVSADVAADYEPGQFYKRELPCLLTALKSVGDAVSTVVIDGYVWLAPDRPGLGWHLYQAVSGRVAVVGVAKSAFSGNATPRTIRRGLSRQSLYVTAIGLDVDLAAEAVRTMAGPYRIPTLLKLADTLSRSNV